jgi:hypothetical protein
MIDARVWSGFNLSKAARRQCQMVFCRTSSKALERLPRINKTLLNIDYIKASIRAKVGHPLWIIKCQFGFRKKAIEA